MNKLRCFAWGALLLVAASGPQECRGHRRARDRESTAPVRPAEPVRPQIDGTDFPVAPLGSRLEIRGTGFSEATRVLLGGFEQVPMTVLDDERLRIESLVSTTPFGAQDLIVETAEASSAPFSVEVVGVSLQPGVLAHGSAPRLLLMGRAAGFGLLDVYLAGVPIEPTPLEPDLVMLGEVPDLVPVGLQDLELTSDGTPFAPFPVPVVHLVLNEVDVCQTGRDDEEFVEIGVAEAGLALDGYVLVFYNGSNDRSYGAFDLASPLVGHSNADGLVLIASEGLLMSPGVGNTLGISSVQNGADAVALYQGSVADFPNGTLVTNHRLLDALVYDTSDADDLDLLGALLGAGEQALQVNENAAGDAESDSIIRLSPERLDGRAFGAGVPTPGSPNQAR